MDDTPSEPAEKREPDRSWQDNRFLKAPRALIDDKRIGSFTLNELRVYLVYCRHVGNDPRSQPGIFAVADILGLDGSDARKACRRLVKDGWLEKLAEGGGRHNVSTYRPVVPGKTRGDSPPVSADKTWGDSPPVSTNENWGEIPPQTGGKTPRKLGGNSPALIDLSVDHELDQGAKSGCAAPADVAVAKTAKAKSSAKSSSGPHVELRSYFVACWESKYGRKFPFAKRDGVAIAKVLEFEGGRVGEAKAAIDRYLADDSDFFLGHSTGKLVSQYHRFAVKRMNGHAKTPSVSPARVRKDN